MLILTIVIELLILYLTAPNAPTVTLTATSSTIIRVMWTPVSCCCDNEYQNHEAVILAAKH